MNQERSVEEIKNHRLHFFPDSEMYRVVKCEFSEDFELSVISLTLTVKHEDTGSTKRLRFHNATLNKDLFTELRDATGLYFMDTSYLGWKQENRVEVGDWDGGSPILWAEDVEVLADRREK